MKNFLIKLTKRYKWIRSIYMFIGSISINIFKCFIKTDEKIILFNSFGGKKYDDSPKEIYEAMINDKRFSQYKLFWAFHQPDKFSIELGNKVKVDSLEYFIIALKARCWITNSSIQRNLDFKGKNTFLLNTWHGTPIKKMGRDLGMKTDFKNVDIMTIQGEYEKEIFNKAFEIDLIKMVPSGLPRNDILIKQNEIIKKEIKEKLGIRNNKKIILYAPTFRDYEINGKINNIIDPPIDFELWSDALSEEYVMLLRSHYEVSRSLNYKKKNSFVYDCSDYDSLNELMIASDLLISDYSSIFFDYSLLEKPMFCYTYDYDKYNSKRGLYFDIRNELPGGSISEQELIRLIKTYSEKEILSQVISFKEKYVKYYGNATYTVLDIIHQNIK